MNSSCYEGLLKEIESDVEKCLNELIKVITDNINLKIENIISEMEKKIEIENLTNIITKIIVEIFHYFFFLSTELEIDEQYTATLKNSNLRNLISNKTLNNIQKSVKENLNEFMDIYNNNLSQLIENTKEELLKEEKNFKSNFLLENKDIKLSDIDTPGETDRSLKNFISYRLEQKAKTAAFKNFFKSITVPFIKQFEIEYKKLYKRALTMDYLKKERRKVVEISFDKIEEKIKKYYQEKKEKKNNSNEDISSETKEVKNENKKEEKGLTCDDYDNMIAQDEDLRNDN